MNFRPSLDRLHDRIVADATAIAPPAAPADPTVAAPAAPVAPDPSLLTQPVPAVVLPPVYTTSPTGGIVPVQPAPADPSATAPVTFNPITSEGSDPTNGDPIDPTDPLVISLPPDVQPIDVGY